MFSGDYAGASSVLAKMIIASGNDSQDMEFLNAICGYYLGELEYSRHVFVKYFTDPEKIFNPQSGIRNRALLKTGFLYYNHVSIMLGNEAPDYIDDLNRLVPRYLTSGVLSGILQKSLGSFREDPVGAYLETAVARDIDELEESIKGCIILPMPCAGNLSGKEDHFKDYVTDLLGKLSIRDTHDIKRPDALYIMAMIYFKLDMPNQFLHAVDRLMERPSPGHEAVFETAADYCYDMLYADKAIEYFEFIQNYFGGRGRDVMRKKIAKLKQCVRLGIYAEV